MQTIEREPLMQPTIIRRVHAGAVEFIERRWFGRPAISVFWSVEHAEEHMRERWPADQGWEPLERDHEELRLVFDLLRSIGELEYVYVEPPPGHPDLGGLFKPDEFVFALENTLDD